MAGQSKQKKRGIHVLTRLIIFMILISIVPIAMAAYSIKEFNKFHQDDIDLRQYDVILRVGNDLDKEFAESPAEGQELKDRLKKVITESANKRTGYIYITDDRGILLAHSDKDVLTELNLSATPIVGGKLFPGTIRTEGQTRYESYWGKPVAGTGLLKNISGLNRKLGIFVELPTLEADQIYVDLVRTFIIITFLALCLTAISGFYLASKIIPPIRELLGGTTRVSLEKFDQPVKVDSGDEIEDLGEAFNKMMGGLKELKELREEFIFVAAHELRTPVTAIKGFIQLVLDNAKKENFETNLTYLNRALSANERLITLVNDLLEVAREEAGRLEIEVRPTEISEPIQKVLLELAPLASSKVELIYKPEAGLPKVLADERRIGEIVTNLVGNSIKYMGGNGSVTITHEISTGGGSASGGKEGKLITHISDTGTGISKEAQAKLFEKFYRVYNEKTKEVKGTGLGLFIVKKIIEKMGGNIWVTSPTQPDGTGTTFSFELPIESPQSSTNS